MKDWNEALLDKELESLIEEFPEEQDLDKKIEESIRKKIRKTVVKTVSMLVAGGMALFLIINPIMNAMFLDPAKLNKQSKVESAEGINENGVSTLFCVLQDYWETSQPYAELISVDVEKNGFSRYELSMQVANHRDSLNMGPANVWCEVAFGEYKNWKDSDQLVTKMFGRFDATWADKEEYITQIEELPQSAVLYLSIGATEAKKVEDLQMEEVDLEWVQVYQPNVDFQGGISLRMYAAVDETDKRDSLTPQELKDVYIANLENLLENIDIWKPLGLFDGNAAYMQEEAVLRKTYEDAKTLDVLESKNYCISGKRDVIVEYLKNTEISSILVDDIQLSSLI